MDFPDWVTAPTACATRTFKVVLPTYTPHRAVHLIQSFPNRPTVTVRRIDAPHDMQTSWSDKKIDPRFEIVPAAEEN